MGWRRRQACCLEKPRNRLGRNAPRGQKNTAGGHKGSTGSSLVPYQVVRAAASALVVGTCDPACCPDCSAAIDRVNDVEIRVSFAQERDRRVLRIREQENRRSWSTVGGRPSSFSHNSKWPNSICLRVVNKTLAFARNMI